MTGTATIVVVLLLLLGLLAGAAWLLERRAKTKGDLLTGTRSQQPQSGDRARTYLSLLTTLLGLVLGTWGILSQSWSLLVVGGLLLILSVGFGYYWRFRRLIEGDKQDEQDERYQ